MPTRDKNHDGNHSHPQNAGKNQSQGDPAKDAQGKDRGAKKAEKTGQPDLGAGRAKDNH